MLSPQDIPGAAFLQMLLDSCTRVLGVWLSVWGLLVSLAFDHLFLLLWVHTYYIRAQLDVLVGFRTISYETYRSWLGTFQDFFFFLSLWFFFLFFLFSFFSFSDYYLPCFRSVCRLEFSIPCVFGCWDEAGAGSRVRAVVFLRAVSRCCTVLVFGTSMLYTYPPWAEMAGLMFQEVEYVVDIV